MATKYRLEANISDEARVIVLSETNMSIEDNQASVSGTYTNEDLTNNNKIILARRPNGETFGYGGVAPVGYQAGPDVPFTETFDGVNGTQPSSELWTLDSNASSKGYLDGTGRWYWYSHSAVNTDVTGIVTFNYALGGNFDVNVSINSSGTAASAGYTGSYTRLRVVNASSLSTGVGVNNTTIAGYTYRIAYENLSGSYNQVTQLVTSTEGNPTTYRIYRVNGDTIRMQYANQWNGGGAGSYWECPEKESGPVTPSIAFREGSNNSFWRVYIYTFNVVAGTIE